MIEIRVPRDRAEAAITFWHTAAPESGMTIGGHDTPAVLPVITPVNRTVEEEARHLAAHGARLEATPDPYSAEMTAPGGTRFIITANPDIQPLPIPPDIPGKTVTAKIDL
ncbi:MULTISPECIES: hypothetical protein [Streptomycetaceae]|uniref:Uncharacterized protein n=1 Tax=Streptantibioticus cattleyicolor (strain ATCC 35852 / DSM 46488 / JCM 4925 / NBRC 14057 / NRRL 8057) TaxID=1003195 RepID=G8WSU1_STREN|nr:MULTISPECIES: hypothetical protein [Streptomycetaceae]AEW96647.1 hypothetical protein SCATT_42760 [Streptantibioticus cattleyicolor NRRL 8057 = DSM 46488]MYS61141.1 hypothetical protein [Streptomyces sp. SID5468]